MCVHASLEFHSFDTPGFEYSRIMSAKKCLDLQGRHKFSKTEGAAQKLGGQNIKNDLTFHVFGVKFQG